ncbi:MAG: hypothetical protein ACKVVT_07065 [Dehalococcoidia bacterium]
MDRTYRVWRFARVRAGVVYRTAAGPLLVESVRACEPGELTEGLAKAAGFASVTDLLDAIGVIEAGQTLFEVVFRPAPALPKPSLGVGETLAALARLDARSAHGPWTAAALSAIRAAPGRRAADLSAELGRERLAFKADVRKLKGLGLTESLEVGYRLTARGEAVAIAFVDGGR